MHEYAFWLPTNVLQRWLTCGGERSPHRSPASLGNLRWGNALSQKLKAGEMAFPCVLSIWHFNQWIQRHKTYRQKKGKNKVHLQSRSAVSGDSRLLRSSGFSTDSWWLCWSKLGVDDAMFRLIGTALISSVFVWWYDIRVDTMATTALLVRVDWFYFLAVFQRNPVRLVVVVYGFPVGSCHTQHQSLHWSTIIFAQRHAPTWR